MAAATQGSHDRPTIRDVAKLAGVGLATVSRVLNQSGYVASTTRQRVLAAVDELSFSRNEAARMLRPGQPARTIGVKVGDLTNPFYAQIAMGAVRAAREQGWAVMLGTSDEDPAEERKFVDTLLERRVAGLVTVPDGSGHDYLLDDAGALRVPVVFIDRPADHALEADEVVIDNAHGAHLATTQFVEHGHRRIAILVAPSHYTTQQRYLGYERALAEAGIAVDPSLVKRLERGSSAHSAIATRELLALPDPPTAIFSTTNFLTEGALMALRPHPHIALIGFDDFHLAGLLPTPVSVVRCDVPEIGQLAVRLLIERSSGRPRTVQRHVIPVEYVARGSGELPPTPPTRDTELTLTGP